MGGWVKEEEEEKEKKRWVGGWVGGWVTNLVGAEAVCFSIVLDSEAVVEEETVVAFLPIGVVDLKEWVGGWVGGWVMGG